MVHWKDVKTLERVVGTILAAHPTFKPDYHAMAAIFGQDVTYDAIQYQFRSFKKISEDLKSEARSRGIDTPPHGHSTPKTPRAPRTPMSGKVSKSSSSSSTKSKSSKSSLQSALSTPTKGGHGMTPFDAICLDEGENDVKPEIKPEVKPEPETKPKVKTERELEIERKRASLSAANFDDSDEDPFGPIKAERTTTTAAQESPLFMPYQPADLRAAGISENFFTAPSFVDTEDDDHYADAV